MLVEHKVTEKCCKLVGPRDLGWNKLADVPASVARSQGDLQVPVSSTRVLFKPAYGKGRGLPPPLGYFDSIMFICVKKSII